MSREASDSQSSPRASVPEPNSTPSQPNASPTPKRRGKSGITLGPSDNRAESPWVTLNWIIIPILLTMAAALAITQSG